jgi:hypothetical protein
MLAPHRMTANKAREPKNAGGAEDFFFMFLFQGFKYEGRREEAGRGRPRANRRARTINVRPGKARQISQKSEIVSLTSSESQLAMSWPNAVPSSGALTVSKRSETSFSFWDAGDLPRANRSALFQVIDLDDTDAGAAVLPSEDRGEGSRWQRGEDRSFFRIAWGEVVGDQVCR